MFLCGPVSKKLSCHSWKLRSQKKYCDLKRLKPIELMVSDSSDVYRSERY